jgi:hypothetical protein
MQSNGKWVDFGLLQGDLRVGDQRSNTIIYVFLLKLLLVLAAMLGAVRISCFLRARAMRRFAAKWSLQYLGPSVPRQWWWDTSRLETGPPVPPWVSRFGITRVWNIIEGKKDGKRIIIFDSLVGSFKSQWRTFIMCQTSQNPFETGTSADRVVQTRGWTLLSSIWLLWFSWPMGIGRLDRHLRQFRSE